MKCELSVVNLVAEAVFAVYHAQHFDNAFYLIQAAEFGFQYRQVINTHQAGCLVTLFQGYTLKIKNI